MISETDVMDRAVYCYCVCLQLNWLLSNDSLAPPEYLGALQNSSLKLAEDDFIGQSIVEALASGEEDGGLNSLILIYESFAFAYCEVLEIELTDLRHSFLSANWKSLPQRSGPNWGRTTMWPGNLHGINKERNSRGVRHNRTSARAQGRAPIQVPSLL